MGVPEHDDDWRSVLSLALEEARSAVERHAGKCEAPVHELSSTLILLIATSELACAGQIGDGAVVFGHDCGKIHRLTAPMVGEFANETIFLVSPGALEMAQAEILHGRIEHLAVFTDGIQHLCLRMPRADVFAPFFEPLFRFAGGMTDPDEAKLQLGALVRSPRLLDRVDDDITLMIASLGRSDGDGA